MKLIKLSGKSGEFQNIFNEDIRIKPFSKIGLKSASILFEGVEINDNNNQFGVKTKSKNPMYAVTLNNGTYNVPEFINELIRGLNASLGYLQDGTTLSELIYQFNTKVNSLSIPTIYFKRGDLTENPLMQMKNMIFNADDEYKREGGTPDTWDCYAFSDKYMCNGICKSTIYINEDDINVCFGLIHEKPDKTNVAQLEPTDYNFSIYYFGDYYHFWDGTQSHQSQFSLEEDDQIEIQLVGGNLYFKVYRSIADPPQYLEIGSVLWTYDTKYFLAFSLYNANAYVQNVYFSFDPYITQTADELYSVHNDFDVHKLGAISSKTTIDFNYMNKSDSAVLCGYYQTILNKTASSGYFPADFSPNNQLPNNIMIEMPNITIESYDGKKHRRQSVIGYLSNLDMKHHKLEYETDKPLMIDMNNSSAFNLNNIKIRVLPINEEDNEVLKCEDVMILLVVE